MYWRGQGHARTCCQRPINVTSVFRRVGEPDATSEAAPVTVDGMLLVRSHVTCTTVGPLGIC